MKLEHASQSKIEKEILNVLGHYLPVERFKVFFFGSRTSGRADERADIDVGIEGEAPVPALSLAKIRDEIKEIPLLYRIDVVDMKGVDKDFREIALQDTELFSSPVC